MSDLLQNLLHLNPSIKSLDEQMIANAENQIVGWNHFFYDTSGFPIAGGTSSNKETSKKIAIAECFEREIFKKLILSKKDSDNLLLDQSPSTSGFAAGFQEATTAYRSLCEAVERWAWSKWIDEKFKIEEVSLPNDTTELTKHLLTSFSSHRAFQKKIPRVIVKNQAFDFTLSIFLGIKDSGVFAGSRVTSALDEPWEHALIEANRNLSNFKIGKEPFKEFGSVITERAHYFATNYEEAKSQFEDSYRTDWQTPQFLIHTKVNTGVEGLFLYRSLCSDFKHWHLGSKQRFVY